MKTQPRTGDAEVQWRQLVKDMEAWNRIVMNLVRALAVKVPLLWDLNLFCLSNTGIELFGSGCVGIL